VTRAEESEVDLARLIRNDYAEMPGLVLTSPQLCRMFGIDGPTSDAVTRELIEAGVLVRRPNGSYAKRRGPDVGARPSRPER
jgi:hypothetical protein